MTSNEMFPRLVTLARLLLSGKPKVTPNILIEKIPKITKELAARGFRKGANFLESGDCANFAIALGKVLGISKYVCSWEDDGWLQDGYPAHCALLWKGKLWDAGGITTERKLFDMAYNEDNEELFSEYDNPEEKVRSMIVVDKVNDSHPMRQIVNTSRISIIEKVIRKHLE